MRTGLRILAALLLAVGFITWAALGGHTGWTRTTDTRMELDPITEIEFPVIEEKFLPGVDFLGGAFFVSVVLFGVSFAFNKKQKSK